MSGRMEFDKDAKSARGEEKTNDLRMKNGKVQQKFIITVLPAGQMMQVTEEWRDIPEEN